MIILPDHRINSFQVGQIWENSRGKKFQVESVERGGKAILISLEGKGRRYAPWDGIAAWCIVYDPEFPKFRSGPVS